MTDSSKPLGEGEAMLPAHGADLRLQRITVIADDLTGACDSGVAFLRCGRRVRVVLNASDWHEKMMRSAMAEDDAPVWVLTTETRDTAEDEAGERVRDCVARVDRGGLIFKKVDSTARGHFAVEIGAALRASGAACALVAPAFPATGRTVQAGVLYVRDWSGQDARVDLRGLFARVEGERISVLGAGEASELEMGITRAVAAGTRVLLCDAMAQEDLERLAQAGLMARGPLLWAGSAALAHALAGVFPAVASRTEVPFVRQRGRTLLFTGSPHPVTLGQIAYLERAPCVADRAMHRVPSSGASERAVIDAFYAGPVGGLVLTGGDTAAFVLRALGARGIELVGEVTHGIPWGVIEGGMADGCTVVTKSGGFGEPDALVKAFAFCEGRTK